MVRPECVTLGWCGLAAMTRTVRSRFAHDKKLPEKWI
jgi:hypothetical protein